MPNPDNYDSKEKWMGDCVHTRVAEGDSQEQAVAVCLSMWDKKEEKKEIFRGAIFP